MYIHLKFDNQPVYTLGDLHGDFDHLMTEFKNKDIENCLFIICGDIGFGFSNIKYHDRKAREMNNQLKERGITLLCFRGNHDDPSYFNRDIENVDEPQDFWLSNFKLVPDYTIVSVNGKNLLLIGGATSIDRIGRRIQDANTIKSFLDFYPKLTLEEAKNMIAPSYWPDESPNFNPEILDEITENGILITHVLTHTCPSFAFPRDKRGVKEWLKHDSELEKDLHEERDTMDKIYNHLTRKFHPLEEWVYGHYHTHFQEDMYGIRFTTLFNTDYKFDAYEITRGNIEDYAL